ncbi:lysine--tRNA ligase [candidate division TM6 bacterium RIFCSPHIGHO2_12_FULL_38_8]|nr:MAG: lysine--tRNA ligase [candidate division TM6 bacterium RIFCSPHIGHO2_12_FULL_38_8]
MEPKPKSADELNDHLGHVSQEHEIRIQKVKKLQNQGINPWPVVQTPTATAQQLLSSFVENDNKIYELVGRVMTKRLHGKAAFVHMQDASGKIQIYLKEDVVGSDAFSFFEHSIDIGDILWVQGSMFKTQRGEISLRAAKLQLQSKCLHPLPEKFHGLHDVEVRYRQRYLDLICNEQSRQLLIKRSLIVQTIREFLTEKNYLEVETPMLHPIPGGAAAKPFKTHHNALGQDFYLRIAPELYLKRLVVGGLDRVFEINRNFRNEGISTKHNPEFSMLECYTAHHDLAYAMDLIEAIFQTVAKKIGVSTVQFGDYTIDFLKKFERISLYDAVKKYHKLSNADFTDAKIDALLNIHKVSLPKLNMNLAEKIYLLFAETVEKELIAPTFVTGFPVEVSPLAKRDAKNPDLASRAELFVAGLELANLFDELNDPFDQAARFTQQVQAKNSGDVEAHEYDADYILALEYGLPPTVGLGVGIDRMVMLMTGTTSIKDVILFPTLKKR